MRKTEDLTLLTDSEISERLVKIAKRVPQAFGLLVIIAIALTAIGFNLNSSGNTTGGAIVSVIGAAVVILGALYMRNLRRKNEALIQLSKAR